MGISPLNIIYCLIWGKSLSREWTQKTPVVLLTSGNCVFNCMPKRKGLINLNVLYKENCPKFFIRPTSKVVSVFSTQKPP